MYDVIIIGAGPAGLTAGIYCARKKLNTLVIGEVTGGQAAWSGEVENYLGYQMITGPELANKFREHLKLIDEKNKEYDLEFLEGERVVEVKCQMLNVKCQIFEVKTAKGKIYQGKTLIIASGKVPRKLGAPGEDKFKGRGVTYCATCDAPLFRGKEVAVIGGGNSALDATLQLMKLCPKVYLINITPALGGDKVMREKVEAAENVEILNNRETREVMGDKLVNAIKVLNKENGKEEIYDVKGIFIEIGSIPATEFVRGLVELNQWGEIKINRRNETSVPGIFAAGDVTEEKEKQIIIAAGEGAKAALSVFEYLSKQR